MDRELTERQFTGLYVRQISQRLHQTADRLASAVPTVPHVSGRTWSVDIPAIVPWALSLLNGMTVLGLLFARTDWLLPGRTGRRD
jgi:hypothetical protein